MLDDGGLVAEGTSTELKRRVPGGRVEVSYAGPGPLAAAASAITGAVPHEETMTLNVPHDGSLASLRAQ